MDKIPVRQFSFGWLTGNDFDNQAVEAMNEYAMGMFPAFVFRSFLLAVAAIPALFYPIVAIEKRFDGIAEFKIQKKTRPLLGLNLPLSG
jgi:hypothetical protein